MTKTQIIELTQGDDIISLKDRLDWVDVSRVLFVLPTNGHLLHKPVELMLLRRHAGNLRVEIGLVTHDPIVISEAKGVGIPTFPTVEVARKQRQWRRFRQKQWQRPPNLHDDDQREIHRRRAPLPLWKRWLWRYAGIAVFFSVSAFVILTLIYTVPSATITLAPHNKPLEVMRQIIADPQLESVNYSGASVPARRVVVTEEWQASVETTGSIEVPDALARGKVIFVNKQEEGVRVSAGTRVSTSLGQSIVFQTLRDLDVPGVIGATAETDVVAIQPGNAGNVAANLINQVEGTLGLLVEVRNLEPLTGGGNRLVRAVTLADQDRLRAQVVQQLQTLALVDMRLQLENNEFLAQDSLRLLTTHHETFSHFVDEPTERLVLEIRADLQATAIDETQAIGLVYEELATAVEPGFVLVPNSLDFRSGNVLGVDNQGRVSFEMWGTGQVAAALNVDGPLANIAGQPVDLALAYLDQQLPLRTFPTIRVSPSWLDRVPYMPARIRVELDES